MLGVYSGTGQIRLDGSNGIITEVQSGDVIVIPVGVGNEALGPQPTSELWAPIPRDRPPMSKKGNLKSANV